MEINSTIIKDGGMIGQVVYICDFRCTDIHKKPLRKVPPTEAMVCDNDEIKKTIYYSKTHFRPMSKGKPLAKVIPLFDNTGYRSLTGNPLYVFNDMQSCQEKWNELLDEHIDRLEKYRQSVDGQLLKEIEKLTKEKE